MVIDDEWPALEQMRELLLQCEGISSILVYDNPREAFTAAVEQKPDILFLDIQMPELSGLAFAEKLLPYSPDTDIVFVTAYRNYAVEAFELSAVDYLLKPVDPSRLLKTWNKLLTKRMLSSTAETRAVTTFRLLGDYELTGPHGTVKWNTHKAEELFAYLWVHRQGSVSVILNDVFPQWNYEKGKQYLHTTVYQIRKTLKKAALEESIELSFDRENYRLESRGIEDDTEKFNDTATRALGNNQLEDMRAAAALYQGDLLQSLDSLWVYSTRDKYRRLYLKLLEKLTLGLVQAGRPYEAEDYAVRLTELEPLEESYALQLISLYYEIGKPLRAQRKFTQFRDSYKAEMGDGLPDWFLEVYQRLGK
ncbi:response regulator [Paenibacillus sp. MMS20-IR301]|uniref:response regulator n=1 Tax=Paenibacillus sp. MMS20-IR301 TaxID=2895946 RepID=UPI0028F0037E|nr:response regulator [Paenibacillus sp. MMS20-IR301]WNS42526.1 response regulator [Paenibacillus sp. MMS20-IR301]